MIRTLVTTAVALTLFIGAAFAENFIVTNSFANFDKELEVLYDKTVDETATTDDVLSVQKFWVGKKEILHIAIPHTEIKEVDLWISEAVRLVEQKNFDEAAQKIEVTRELCEQIPRTFKLRIENIF